MTPGYVVVPDHATLPLEELQRRIEATQRLEHVWVNPGSGRGGPFCARCGFWRSATNVPKFCRVHGE